MIGTRKLGELSQRSTKPLKYFIKHYILLDVRFWASYNTIPSAHAYQRGIYYLEGMCQKVYYQHSLLKLWFPQLGCGENKRKGKGRLMGMWRKQIYMHVLIIKYQVFFLYLQLVHQLSMLSSKAFVYSKQINQLCITKQ